MPAPVAHPLSPLVLPSPPRLWRYRRQPRAARRPCWRRLCPSYGRVATLWERAQLLPAVPHPTPCRPCPAAFSLPDPDPSRRRLALRRARGRFFHAARLSEGPARAGRRQNPGLRSWLDQRFPFRRIRRVLAATSCLPACLPACRGRAYRTTCASRSMTPVSSSTAASMSALATILPVFGLIPRLANSSSKRDTTDSSRPASTTGIPLRFL